MDQRPRQPGASFVDTASPVPKYEQRTGQAQARLAMFRLRQAPFQGRPQIIVFGLDLAEPFNLLTATQPRPSLLGPLQEEFQMPVSQMVTLPGFDQPLARILTDGL